MTQKEELLAYYGIQVVKVANSYYALSGWNGERYLNCWETDENGFETDNKERYIVRPVYRYEIDGREITNDNVNEMSDIVFYEVQ